MTPQQEGRMLTGVLGVCVAVFAIAAYRHKQQQKEIWADTAPVATMTADAGAAPPPRIQPRARRGMDKE